MGSEHIDDWPAISCGIVLLSRQATRQTVAGADVIPGVDAKWNRALSPTRACLSAELHADGASPQVNAFDVKFLTLEQAHPAVQTTMAQMRCFHPQISIADHSRLPSVSQGIASSS